MVASTNLIQDTKYLIPAFVYFCGMMKVMFRLIGIILNLIAYISPKLVKKITFQLFCLPVSKKLTDSQSAYLENAFLEFADLEGEKMAIYRWGDGPKTVALFHGWRSHSYRWRNHITAYVDRGYTVYALDAPAHGNSEGRLVTLPKYSDAIDLVLEKYPADVVIAHSFGGLATLYSFYRKPALTSKDLVLLASAGTVEDFINFFFDNARLSKRTQGYVNEYFIEITGKLPKDFCLDNFVPGMKARTLIIHDQNDPDVSVRHAYRLHELLPDSSELMITQDQEHNLKGHKILKKILSFTED